MMIASVTDRRRCVRSLPEQTELICGAGADMVVLREKDLPGPELEALAKIIKDICGRHGTVFCIASAPELAERLGAASWTPVAWFRESGRPGTAVAGASVHSLEEGLEAEDLGADFIVYGNVYETSCKPGAPARGLEELSVLCASARIPVYAIGGVSEENIGEVARAGASGACMMSGLMSALDPAATISECRKAVGS